MRRAPGPTRSALVVSFLAGACGPLLLVALAVPLLLGACGSTPTRPAQQPTASLSDLHRPRLNRVHAQAPEIADLVVQLRGLAAERARDGDAELARRLASLAELTLLSASELITRLEASELRARANVLATREQDGGDAQRALGSETQGEEAANQARTGRPIRRSLPSVLPSEETEGSDAEAPPDDAALVSQRLAGLAGQLSQIEPPGDDSVVIEGVQTRLIEADRALAEGLTQRAAELAHEAERLLSSVTGVAPSPPVQNGNTFLRDARERLGERALVHGTSVAVRLDDVVRWGGNGWRPRGGGRALTGLRALVRGYRDASLTLVRVGDPSHSAFAGEADSLKRFLAMRFQIAEERIRVLESTRLPLSPGTYFIVGNGNEE